MFGFNPVVEVDWSDPVGQLEAILRDPEAYQSVIERNFAAVSRNHQPRQFVERVNAIIDARLMHASR
jgi:hypothetical protein